MDGIHVAFQGRIGQDPERRYTPSGTEVVQFSVLPIDSKADQEHPEWVKCSIFADKIDELAAAKLAKGAEVYIEGRLRLGRWSGADGTPRSGLNVNAWTVQPFGAIGRRSPSSRERVVAGRGAARHTDWPPEAAG